MKKHGRKNMTYVVNLNVMMSMALRVDVECKIQFSIDEVGQ